MTQNLIDNNSSISILLFVSILQWTIGCTFDDESLLDRDHTGGKQRSDLGRKHVLCIVDDVQYAHPIIRIATILLLQKQNCLWIAKSANSDSNEPTDHQRTSAGVNRSERYYYTNISSSTVRIT